MTKKELKKWLDDEVALRKQLKEHDQDIAFDDAVLLCGVLIYRTPMLLDMAAAVERKTKEIGPAIAGQNTRIVFRYKGVVFFTYTDNKEVKNA